MRFMDRLKRILQKVRGGGPSSAQILPALRRLLYAIEQTQDVEYSCDEVYQLLDQYAEAVERGEDTEQLMPLVKHHLDLCPDCREEFEALLNVLEGNPA